MARRTKRESRASERLRETAIKLLVLGVGLLLTSTLLRSSVLGKALSLLFPLSLVLLVTGGALFWFARSRDSENLSQGTGGRLSPQPSRRNSAGRSPPARDASQAAGPAQSPVEIIPANSGPTLVPQASERRKPVAWAPDVFAVIEWRRFEAVVERLFEQAGFETRSQSHGADMGVDVWLYSKTDPTQPVSVVQCKHWQGKRVGVDKIRELRGVMAAHGVRRGQFATTSTFTPDALAFGTDNSINLLDVDRLLALIAQRTAEQQAQLLDVALEGDYWRPTCVNCGTKMIERIPRKGGSAFWGCPSYPRCKTTMAMGRT